MQVAKLSALLHIRHHFWRTVAAFVLALVFIQAFAVACGGSSSSPPASGKSTPTTSRPPVTQTPGIGVPVKGGNWQITIVNASRTTTWKTYTTKSGKVFLVLDVTFNNLSSSQKTIISTTDAMVISQDGEMFTADFFEIKNSDIDNLLGHPIASGTFTGFSCFSSVCQGKFGVSGNSMSITLVYILDASLSSSTNLKFQFQQVPPIPFSAT